MITLFYCFEPFLQYNFLHQNTLVDPMTLMTSNLVTIATDYRQRVLVGRIFVIE